MQKRQIPMWEIIIACAIILLAGVLRTIWPGITEFKADEARLMTLAFDMAEFKYFPIRGISSSVGLPNFPASVWVYALPLFVWKHIYSATIFTGLLNTGAVALCYFFTRRYVGRTAAIVATLMFAVSPWAVIHSRKIWAQNLLPIFVMVWAFSAALAFAEGRKKWLVVHVAVGVFAAQIHLAAAGLLVASAVLFLIFWRQISWGSFLAGCNIALLTLAPFLYYVFIRSSGGVPGMSDGSSRGFSFSLEPFVHVARLTTGWQFHALAGPDQFQNLLDLLPPLNWLFLVWGLICLSGLSLLISDLWFLLTEESVPEQPSRLRPEISKLLLVWAFVPILTFLWFPVQVELHYLLPVYPVFYIAAGVAVETLTSGNWQKAFLGGLAITGGVQIYAILSLIGFVGVIDTPGGFGDPVSMQLQDAAQAKRWAVSTQAKEILIVSDGSDPLLDSQAAIYELHFRDFPHRFIDGTHSAVFPAESSVVFIAKPDLPVEPIYSPLTSNLASTSSRSFDRGLILTLAGESAPILTESFDPVYLLANFVNVQGVDWPDRNGRFLIKWKVGEAYQPDYHLTGQLFSAEGDKITQADVPTFPADQWQPDDVVLSLFTLDETPDMDAAEQLSIGMYVFSSEEAVPILDAAANPAGDFIELSIP
ncbi:MAG: ArnT family glycosyltransferase [Anaerolineae bacterium]